MENHSEPTITVTDINAKLFCYKNSLETIVGSRSWALILFYYFIKNKFLPSGSKRHTYLNLLLDFIWNIIRTISIVINEIKFIQLSLASKKEPLSSPINFSNTIKNSIIIGFDTKFLNRNNWTGTERYINCLLKEFQYSENSKSYFHIININNNYPRDILANLDNVHIFHRPLQLFTIFDLLSLLKAPCRIITILDLIAYNNPAYFSAISHYQFYRKLMQIAVRIADGIITLSEYGKKDILQTFEIEKSKIKTIYLGVDDIFTSNNYKNEYYSNKIKLTGSYFLYVGTDYPHKNLKIIIRAYKMIENKIQNLPSLVIAGYSIAEIYRNELIKEANGSKNIIFVDYFSEKDIHLLYAGADALIYPSLYEGFGLPILEAMACKVPVLASNSASIPEIAGDAALLVDCTNIKDICDGIMNLSANTSLRKSLIAKGLERSKTFSWAKTAKETTEFYKTIYERSKNQKKQIDELTEKEINALFKAHSHVLDNKMKDIINDILRNNGLSRAF